MLNTTHPTRAIAADLAACRAECKTPLRLAHRTGEE